MEQIRTLVEELGETLQKSGLYLENVEIGTNKTEFLDEEGDTMAVSDIDIRKELLEGDAQFVVTATFTIGDLAFSDRVLNPEAFAAKKEFDAIVPAEDDIVLTALQQKLKKGGSFEGLVDEDFDPDSVEW